MKSRGGWADRSFPQVVAGINHNSPQYWVAFVHPLGGFPGFSPTFLKPALLQSFFGFSCLHGRIWHRFSLAMFLWRLPPFHHWRLWILSSVSYCYIFIYYYKKYKQQIMWTPSSFFKGSSFFHCRDIRPSSATEGYRDLLFNILKQGIPRTSYFYHYNCRPIQCGPEEEEQLLLEHQGWEVAGEIAMWKPKCCCGVSAASLAMGKPLMCSHVETIQDPLIEQQPHSCSNHSYNAFI